MLAKQYIAIFLAIVFSVKLITVDTDIFSFILDTNQVVLLNPFCEKKSNNIKETGENLKRPPFQILKLSRNCSNNYQLIAEKKIPEVLYSDYNRCVYRKHLVVSIHPKKLYPPPKYSVAS